MVFSCSLPGGYSTPLSLCWWLLPGPSRIDESDYYYHIPHHPAAYRLMWVTSLIMGGSRDQGITPLTYLSHGGAYAKFGGLCNTIMGDATTPSPWGVISPSRFSPLHPQAWPPPWSLSLSPNPMGAQVPGHPPSLSLKTPWLTPQRQQPLPSSSKINLPTLV